MQGNDEWMNEWTYEEMNVQPNNKPAKPASQPASQTSVAADAKHFNQQINQHGAFVCARAHFLFTDEICNGELG